MQAKQAFSVNSPLKRLLYLIYSKVNMVRDLELIVLFWLEINSKYFEKTIKHVQLYMKLRMTYYRVYIAANFVNF